VPPKEGSRGGGGGPAWVGKMAVEKGKIKGINQRFR